MAGVVKIHPSKQPRRPHFIDAWAERRGLSQADISRELGADKSIVSRWFSGSSPSEPYQEQLAALFGCEPAAIFRDPDDDWLTKFFKGRARDEIERIKATMEVAFPRRRA